MSSPSHKGPRVIAIDFDGTMVRHAYPDVGEEVPGAVRVMRRLQERGDRIILYTMRSGEFLEEAVAWMRERGIVPWSVNVNPEQKDWTESPKAYAHLYIDDAAVGCPLVYPTNGRPYVRWSQVEYLLFGRQSKRSVCPSCGRTAKPRPPAICHNTYHDLRE